MAPRTTKGVKELKRQLNSLPRAVKKAWIDSAETGAVEVVQLAQRLVPVDEGDLRKSIRHFDASRPDKGLIRRIVATDYKARWIEFGTVKRRGQPFFFVAWRALKRRIKARISRNVNKAIKRHFAK